MVLAELGGKITNALQNFSKKEEISEQVLDDLLKEIGNALYSADVSIQLCAQLKKSIKSKVNLNTVATGMNKRKLVQKAVFDGLVELLDSGTEPYQPKKGQTNIIMFVGLQGAGKTTTVSKLAQYYRKKNFRPALVCADTFRAGAFDQLKQNAQRVRVPYWGSYTETDPVKVAEDGVRYFKEQGNDLIIIDTSGRHKQEAALFEEMEMIQETVNPDSVIFVMDSSIGAAAYEQAKAFKEKVKVASVIITKLDGHAKGGGALSAVSATKSPITFIGTGEHMDDLEIFDPRSFVSKLLGYGDIRGVVDKITEVVKEEDMKEMMGRLEQGQFTLRDLQDQFTTILKMGPLDKILEMMPGMNNVMPMLKGQKGEQAPQRIKMFLSILDSCTDEELDNSKPMKEQTRMLRIARGSGRSMGQVKELLEAHKAFASMIEKMKKSGLMSGKGPQNPQQMMSKLQSVVPPQLMNRMGGAGGLQNMMKQFQEMGGFGALGGLGGMPNLFGGRPNK